MGFPEQARGRVWRACMKAARDVRGGWRGTAAVGVAIAALAACDRAIEQPAPGAIAAGVAARAALIPGAGAAARWEHRFTPTAELDRMDAEVCFHGRVPARLEPQVARLRDMISGIVRVRDGQASPLVMGERGIELGSLVPGDCVRYAVDLARATAADALAYGRRTSAWRYGEDLVLSPDYYLLRPAGPLAQATLTARFELPPGMRALVPWPRLEPGGPASDARAGGAQGAMAGADQTAGPYRIPSTSFTWRIHGALGRFDIDEVPAAGARLRVAVLGDGWQVERGALLGWLGEAAELVAGLYHGFPEREAQVLVLPATGRGVVHGNAAQGGGPSIALLVGTAITPAQMREDWVAVHELLHLGMPTVQNDARWLSEGMATYYEPLLRARAGWIPAEEAWEILHDGFRRGSARGNGRTLAEESRDMSETHEYWRVYWSGAAIAMIADVALRRHPGAPTLDEQMRAIRDCCLHATRTWSAEALLEAIAVPGDAPDLASLARGHATGTAFPDLTETYAALGLRFDAQGRLVRLPGALPPAAAALRAALIERSARAPADGGDPWPRASAASSGPSGPGAAASR